MADTTIDISLVPPDVSPMEIGTITNTTSDVFTCIYNKTNKLTLKPNESKNLPLNICIHFAKHLADKIVYAKREKEILEIATKEVQNSDGKYVKMIDDKILFDERKKAISNYREKLWTEMKRVVKTDSKFFSGDDAKSKATGHTNRDEQAVSEDEIVDM